MPSPQHLLLKQLLAAATPALATSRPRLANVRLAAEFSSLLQFMPWNVFLEDVDVDGMAAEWLRPAQADNSRVLLYLHGGGYVLGSLNTHRSLIGTLAQRCGLPAFTIDYRKAPEYPFPAALEDALVAYRWLRGQGYPAENIIVAGDSAGGGLALALALSLREAGEAQPAAIIGLSPWTDLVLPERVLREVCQEETQLLEALQIRDWGTHYAGSTPLTHPLVSPGQAELHGLPPLLIQLSDAEVLCDDGLSFVEKARRAGVPVTLQAFQGLVHWWHLFWRVLPEARQALDDAAGFVRGIWAAQAAAAATLQAARRTASRGGAAQPGRMRAQS
ncbi:alpha/beta hydrolase [Hymenobacter lutimineralis]|uniref:Alpha/beta hydrolase n=1 Tax=Hymenobacter lutimineralis TaxID=2606448 RepID=A0A5D6VFQ1_9BACT|nr:alpha/beta hydrolase [Hymenobacter lutimineralis]TYZ14225.1 alpha/beta hydrolase [Hymenobacter lutimineralis]